MVEEPEIDFDSEAGDSFRDLSQCFMYEGKRMG